jgi:hypothetical protein
MIGTAIPPVAQTAVGNPAWAFVLGIGLLVIFAGIAVYLLWPRHEAEVRTLIAGDLKRAA